MFRKLLLGAGACSLLAGLCVGVGAGTAAANNPPVFMSGPITCTVHGNLIFTTPLKDGGTTPTNFHVFMGLSHCTGAGTKKGAVVVTGGTLKASSTATVNNDCGPLTAGVPMPTMVGTILWKTKSSSATAVGTDIKISSPWIYYQYDYNLLTLGFPTGITYGSYFGETPRFKTLYSNASGGAYTGQCGTGQTGLKTIFFGQPLGGAMGSVTIKAGI
jgi:hypothetical protein